ncbi:hypothetical protein CSW40_09370 [Thermus scotoductus]|uniref:Uncharacterized protein n=1 Tax=Thermus scotoductus TaxID=37636 RepID=A0A430RV09_THESC|nr:hypothetical protein CSW40_09370 [Thermus scotoductus]
MHGKRLAFLGEPLCRGLSDRPSPFVPWEGRMVRPGREIRADEGTVGYVAVGRGWLCHAPFVLEPPR